MKKLLLATALILGANFLYSQGNEWENKRLIQSYLLQARQYARNSNRYIHISQNQSGVWIELPEYIKETGQAAICLNNALRIDANNQNAKKLSIDINMKAALQMYKLGQATTNSYEKQDVYFNRVLEYLANAYESGLDSTTVLYNVHLIDSIENRRLEKDKEPPVQQRNYFYYVSVSYENLYKVSTVSQLKTSQQIDSLNKVISASKDTIDRQTLFNLYAQLLEAAKYYYNDGKFQYGTYNEAFENKVKLAIELGRTDPMDYHDVYNKYREPWYGDYVARQRLIAQIPASNILYDGIDNFISAKAPDAQFILNENGDLTSLIASSTSTSLTVCQALRDTILADGTRSRIYAGKVSSVRTSPVRWCYVQFLDGVEMLLPVPSGFLVEFAYPSGLQPGLHNFVDRLKIETDAEGKTIIRENEVIVQQTPPPPAPKPSFEQQTTASIDYIAERNASQADRITQLEKVISDLQREIGDLQGEIQDLHSGRNGNSWSLSSWENSIPGLREDIEDLYDEIDALRREISDLRSELQRK